MGLSNSTTDKRKQVKGGIHIQIQKTFFVSNEYIQGTVYISLEEQYKGYMLMIGLEGLEETHFTYTTGTGDDEQTVYAEGKNKFLDYTQPIFDFASNDGSPSFILHPGQWQIPFQLQIADKLPSSLKPLEGQQEIIIGQQVGQLDSAISKSIDQNVTCCCCYGLGNLRLQGSLNNNSFSPNDVIKVKFECDASEFSKDVEKLNIQLQGVLRMTSSAKETDTVIINVSEKTVTMNAKKLNSTVDIHIPPSVQLSSTSSLINLKHQILISPQTDGCCVRRSQDYTLDIQINPTPQTYQSMTLPILNQAKAPQNWNPVHLQQQQYSEQQNLHIQQIQLQYKNSISQQDQFNQNVRLIQNQQPIMGRPQ